MLRLGVLDNDGDDLLAVVVGNGCGCIDRHAGDAQYGDSTRQEGTAPLAPFPGSFIHNPNFIGVLLEYMKVDALAARSFPDNRATVAAFGVAPTRGPTPPDEPPGYA